MTGADAGRKLSAITTVTTAETALAIQNVRGEMSRPARSRRRRSDTFSRAFCLFSMSFRVSATCFLRFAAISAVAWMAIFLPRVSLTPATRLSFMRSAETYG